MSVLIKKITWLVTIIGITAPIQFSYSDDMLDFLPAILSASSGTPDADDTIDEGLTDRSNVTCELSIESLSHPVGSSIPESDDYSVTIHYELSERPLDVRVGISASLLNGSSGISLGNFESGFVEKVVGYDEGSESMSGEITFLKEAGFSSGNSYQTLTAACLLYTIYDEDDELNNPGPGIGNEVQFTVNNVEPLSEAINWTLE